MRLPGCCMASVSKPYGQILKVSWLLGVTTQNSSHLQFISCSISRKDFLWEAMESWENDNDDNDDNDNIT